MSLLPIFLKLDGRPGLLVGAGNGRARQDWQPAQDWRPAARHCAGGPAEIRQLAAEGKLEWIERSLRTFRSRRQLRRHCRHRRS